MGNVVAKPFLRRVENFEVLVELPRNALDARVRIALYLDSHEGRHLAGEQAHEVEYAPGAGHLDLSIETAHLDRAVVALK